MAIHNEGQVYIGTAVNREEDDLTRRLRLKSETPLLNVDGNTLMSGNLKVVDDISCNVINIGEGIDTKSTWVNYFMMSNGTYCKQLPLDPTSHVKLVGNQKLEIQNNSIIDAYIDTGANINIKKTDLKINEAQFKKSIWDNDNRLEIIDTNYLKTSFDGKQKITSNINLAGNLEVDQLTVRDTTNFSSKNIFCEQITIAKEGTGENDYGFIKIDDTKTGMMLIANDKQEFRPVEIEGDITIGPDYNTIIGTNKISTNMIKNNQITNDKITSGIDIKKTTLNVDSTTIVWTENTNRNILKVKDDVFVKKIGDTMNGNYTVNGNLIVNNAIRTLQTMTVDGNITINGSYLRM